MIVRRITAIPSSRTRLRNKDCRHVSSASYPSARLSLGGRELTKNEVIPEMRIIVLQFNGKNKGHSDSFTHFWVFVTHSALHNGQVLLALIHFSMQW